MNERDRIASCRIEKLISASSENQVSAIEAVAKPRKVLKEPFADTFLGRQRHAFIKLPEETARAPFRPLVK